MLHVHVVYTRHRSQHTKCNEAKCGFDDPPKHCIFDNLRICCTPVFPDTENTTSPTVNDHGFLSEYMTQKS